MNILLGVTGSIAAYKAAEIVSRLKKQGDDVKVIMTKSGCELITPLTFETLSKNPVVTDMFSRQNPYEVEHISLAQWADVFLVAPATANIIAKYAHGIADDMLSTTLLATKATVVFSPAMNTAMYDNPATQSNIAVLRSRGVHFIEPDSGLLACGDIGRGRMAEPCHIVEFVKSLMNKKSDLTGKSFLITAGATKERIDPVRYITNRSTGKMGVALANAAVRRGASVILVCGDLGLNIDSRVKQVRIESSHDMKCAVMKYVEDCDFLICAAAPADFTPSVYSDKKIKKNESGSLELKLVQTDDILRSVSGLKGDRVFIGFAAETNDVESNAISKLKSKNLDAIAANDVSKSDRGFGVDTNFVTLYTADGGAKQSGMMTKSDLADWLIDNALEIKDKRKS